MSGHIRDGQHSAFRTRELLQGCEGVRMKEDRLVTNAIRPPGGLRDNCSSGSQDHQVSPRSLSSVMVHARENRPNTNVTEFLEQHSLQLQKESTDGYVVAGGTTSEAHSNTEELTERQVLQVVPFHSTSPCEVCHNANQTQNRKPTNSIRNPCPKKQRTETSLNTMLYTF